MSDNKNNMSDNKNNDSEKWPALVLIAIIISLTVILVFGVGG